MVDLVNGALFANLIKKRYPVIPDNQLARGIQAKTVRGFKTVF